MAKFPRKEEEVLDDSHPWRDKEARFPTDDWLRENLFMKFTIASRPNKGEAIWWDKDKNRVPQIEALLRIQRAEEGVGS